MIKPICCLLTLFAVSASYSQVKTVFPIAAKRGMKNAAFSINEQYAFLTDVYNPTTELSMSIYDLKLRRAVKSTKLKFEEELEPWHISNNGRHLYMYNPSGSDQNYNVINQTFEDRRTDAQERKVFANQDAMRFYFPDDYHERDYFDYWFTKQFYVHLIDDQVEVYDTLKQKGELYPADLFKGLKNYGANEVSVSADGTQLLYNKGTKLYLVDLTAQKVIWESDFKVKLIDDLAVFEKGLICFAGRLNKDKTTGIHWYNTLTDEFIEQTTEDQLLNIAYASQFHHFMSVGFGTTTKKQVRKSQYVNLSTGESSSFLVGKGWRSFNDVQAYVKDTLSRSLLTNAEFDSINATKVYYKYWQLKDDYFNESGTYEPKIENPQVSAQFFKDFDGEMSLEIIYAVDDHLTFRNTTGDLGFFGLLLPKQMIYFWNGHKDTQAERLVKFIMTKQEQPLFFCDDNYYFCPGSFVEVLGFEQDLKYYPAEQFDLKYNRPDIILDRLGYADSSLIAAYHAAYKKRLKKMGFTEDMLKDDFHLPEIEIENFEEMPTINDEGSINLKLRLHDSKYKLDRINVWVNDVAIYGKDGISLRDKNVQEYTTDFEVLLAKGNNKVQVSVLNQAGAESYKETFEVQCAAGKDQPNLYLITIGESEFQQADYNLTYAAKDAKDMAKTLSKSEVYREVFTRTLTNEQVTRANILELKSFLEKADINDHVMIFIAGHGVLDANLDYYFATYDMDFQQPQDKGIAYEDLESLLDGIQPLKKTLLIDACHSGEIDKEEVELAQAETKATGDVQFRAVGNTAAPKLGAQNTYELTKSLFTDLRKGTGATVISSAGGMEFAMEGEDWNNGLFTYCLLNGIQTKAADLNNDNEIWLSELKEYVSQQVAELSNGKQQPTSRIENQTVDFRVW